MVHSIAGLSCTDLLAVKVFWSDAVDTTVDAGTQDTCLTMMRMTVTFVVACVAGTGACCRAEDTAAASTAVAEG